MTLSAQDSATIIGSHAAFMQSGVAIDIAARTAGCVSALAIGCGCRVSLERRRVAVFVTRRQSLEVLAALADFPAIAVGFGRPSDHRSIQLKGFDASIEAVLPGDAQIMCAYREAFAADMALIGMSRALSFAYLELDLADVTAVSFTPVAVYGQTPGPAAGELLA